MGKHPTIHNYKHIHVGRLHRASGIRHKHQQPHLPTPIPLHLGRLLLIWTRRLLGEWSGTSTLYLTRPPHRKHKQRAGIHGTNNHNMSGYARRPHPTTLVYSRLQQQLVSGRIHTPIQFQPQRKTNLRRVHPPLVVTISQSALFSQYQWGEHNTVPNIISYWHILNPVKLTLFLCRISI